jgi:hypothetical protein
MNELRPIDKEFLRNKKRLDKVVDYYLKNNILLEIITCNEKVVDGDSQRFGRFIFEKDKLQVMKHRNGHYLLIVKNGIGINFAGIFEAEDIPDRQCICWKEFFG